MTKKQKKAQKKQCVTEAEVAELSETEDKKPILADPGTINSDDEVANYSEASDSEDETGPKAYSATKSDFSRDFEFVGEFGEDMKRDAWDDVFKYVKRKNSAINVDDKIAAVRRERKEGKNKKKQKEVEVKKEDPGSDDDEEGDDESDEESEEESKEDSDSDSDIADVSDEEPLSKENLKRDTVRVKEGDKQRKEKQNKKKKKTEDESEESKENEKFFADEALMGEGADSFTEMNLSQPLLKAIYSMNYEQPTPIQASTIPVALLGRDVCGCAATGTGKTAAFMLPILERLLFRPQALAATRVLVLTPTRELGVQIYQVSKQLAQYTDINIALSVGGLDVNTQGAVLRTSPDIVIATPGRLIDHLKNTLSFALDQIEVLVLDEADRMLDEYFAEQMKEVIRQCSPTRQTLLFSATMTAEVQSLAAVSLKDPVKVFVNNNTDVAQNLRQEFIRVRKQSERDREAMLAYLVSRTFHDHCMVFVQTKMATHRLHVVLGLLGLRVGELHGNLRQALRLENLRRFKNKEIDVLLATDVAARGLDISGVKTVINFSLPSTYRHYVHRVGRTARAGLCGRSISLVGEGEYKMLKEIKKASNSLIFERVLNPEVLKKYSKKLGKLENDVLRVLREEREEREVLKMEAQLEGMKKKLSGEPEEKREWFQTHQERKAEKARLDAAAAGEGDDALPPDSHKMKAFEKKMNKKKKKASPEELEKFRMQRETDKAVRDAKRSRKQTKLRGVEDTRGKPGAAAGRGRGKKRPAGQSSFEKELTSVDDRSVKKFRHNSGYRGSKKRK